MLLPVLWRYLSQNYGLGRDRLGMKASLVKELVVHLKCGDKLWAGSRTTKPRLGEPDPPESTC